MRTAYITRIVVDILLALYVFFYGGIILKWVIQSIEILKMDSTEAFIFIISNTFSTIAIVLVFLGLLNLRHSIKYIVANFVFDLLVVRHLLKSSFYLLVIGIPAAIMLIYISINRLLYDKPFLSLIHI